MSAPKRILQAIAISVAFLLVLAFILFITSSTSYFSELEAIHVFVALVPFIVLLMVSGRLTEIGGPGGISLSMRDEVRKPISPELSKMKLEVDPEITMDKGSRVDLEQQIARNPPTTLSFQIGRTGCYNESAIQHYIDEVHGHPNFRNILLTDREGRFNGLLRVEDFRMLLREGDVVAQLESGRVLEDSRVITASIPIDSTNQQALGEMERLHSNTLAVVDRHEGFVGVISQEGIVRKVLARVLREA
jgi:hypothetical protein